MPNKWIKKIMEEEETKENQTYYAQPLKVEGSVNLTWIDKIMEDTESGVQVSKSKGDDSVLIWL